MGYESKIYIVNVLSHKHTVINPDTQKPYLDKNGEPMIDNGYGQIVAMIDMCKMGYDNGWRELFTKEIDYQIYAENGNESTNKDCYGEHIKSGDINAIIAWLENQIKKDNYRRLKPLLYLLKAFNPEEWDDLQVLHYGH